MNAYHRRYVNALKQAATINRYQKKGYHVFFDGTVAHGKFRLEDGELLFKVSDRLSYLFYQNSKDWDHGYWTPIKTWNKMFHERFEVYQLAWVGAIAAVPTQPHRWACVCLVG